MMLELLKAALISILGAGGVIGGLLALDHWLVRREWKKIRAQGHGYPHE